MTQKGIYRWRVVGASVQGVSHQKADTSCQDNCHVGWHNDVFIAAVADGAGSAQFALDSAVMASMDAVESVFWSLLLPGPDTKIGPIIESVLRKALQSARAMVERAAKPTDIREYASTLLLVVAEPDYVAAAQIGDGAVVVGDEDGNIFALTKPQHGEHANETVFLTSPNAIEEAEIVVWHGQAKNIAIFSDGLQRLALNMPEGTAFTPFFAPLFQFIADMEDTDAAQAQLEAFLKSPRITERTDDDLTLLLAHLDETSF